MRHGFESSRRERWGVILAGGDGVRLRPLTRLIAGDDRPKQFCRVLGQETLLGASAWSAGEAMRAIREERWVLLRRVVSCN